MTALSTILFFILACKIAMVTWLEGTEKVGRAFNAYKVKT